MRRAPARPFSWSDALRTLARPGPAPPGWAGAAAVLLVLCLATIAVLAWLGAAWYRDPHRYFGERKVGTYLSFFNLVGAGGVCALVGRRLGPAPFARFWWIAAAGFVWLGLDDLLVFHERIDRGVHALLGLDPDHPVTDHLDDAIVGGYGVAALALAYRYRRELVGLCWMTLTLAVAFAVFAAMVVIDAMHWSKTLEDGLKVFAGTLIVAGFLAAYLEVPLGDHPGRDRHREPDG